MTNRIKRVMTDLKPCPFCSCKAEAYNMKDRHIHYGVSCSACGSGSGFGMTEQEAADIWNRRAHQEMRRTMSERDDLYYLVQECCGSDPELCSNCTDIQGMADTIERLEATIDALMLEHCPDAMPPEQVARWERNQRPSEEQNQ